ncbi:MAG: hypothetical protein QS721_02955 [Candidatus Endonucleobacter sp. (ex Gigantidas childressi)]|nr:hypothetical protein [Candidatus Endonucleobacter sp. (ex Gigantidas childressi)]
MILQSKVEGDWGVSESSQQPLTFNGMDIYPVAQPHHLTRRKNL